MFAPITHIAPVATIRRERFMPMPGRLLARRGQVVSPSDVVAEGELSPQHLLLDIGRGLGLPPKEADRHLQRKAGDEVDEGDVLAGPLGFSRRVVRAPNAGRVLVAGDGQILLQVESAPFELRAGYSGVVVELIEDRGVIIETNGALVQCGWGNGRINYGLLSVLASSADAQLTPNMLDVSQRGAVIMAGHCADVEVFKAADEIPLRGIILASMEAALLPAALQVSYPIVLTEGFGKQPMNAAAFALLSTSARRETALNAERWDRYSASRPEVVLSLPNEMPGAILSETGRFTQGQSVRVVNPPYQGRVGTLAAIKPGSSLLPNKLRAPAATVRFDDGTTGLVPLANMEILV